MFDKPATGLKKRGEKKNKLSWLKVGQVETVREVSTRTPDGEGAAEGGCCLGFSPCTQGLTLQHAAPMKAMCGPREEGSLLKPDVHQLRCPFFFVCVIYFPVWLSHSRVSLSSISLSLPELSLPVPQDKYLQFWRGNSNEGDGTFWNCSMSVFPQYF